MLPLWQSGTSGVCLHVGVRTWIAEPVVKRATLNKPAETKRAQRKRQRHVHAFEKENREVSDSSDEEVTRNILTVAVGPHGYYVSLLLNG
jgi:hypothetical protein